MNRTRRSPARAAAAVATLVALAGCGESKPPAATATGAVPAARAMAPDGDLNLSEQDRCPVCSMAPAKSPSFASAVELADGRTFYTCGTGCLLRLHLSPADYFGPDAAPIRRAVVPDFFTGRPLDALEARWVAGSDVVGPMGPAMVALGTDADADTFVERHGGAHRFRLGELDAARWREITGRP